MELHLWARLGLGIAISGTIGAVAYWRRSLSESGVIGAILVGTAIFAFGGWEWGVLLVAFFVMSSLLSHYRATTKEALSEKFAKGGRRDLGQALANGGAGAMLAIAHAIWPTQLLWAAFIGAMAAVNADTWATELGVLSRRLPRLLTTWQRVEAGTSGAVSAAGTLATLAGAAAIGLTALGVTMIVRLLSIGAQIAAPPHTREALLLLLVAVVGGGIGSLFDSLLGATIQALYYSPIRDKLTEKRVEPDGSLNEHARGWRWLDNDAVNLISSFLGALVAALCWRILSP
jgi:uncharacterized protein (TIGR00297 family)